MVRFISAVLAVLLSFAVNAEEAPSSAPLPCSDPRAGQFDFWIGEWDIENFHRNPAKADDPTWYTTGIGHNRVLPIVDGCAILEHWFGRLSWGVIHGVSVRQFDPETENWHVVGAWPTTYNPTPSFGSLQGRFFGSRIELFSNWVDPDGNEIDSRLTFSDITADHVRWESETSRDARISWKGGWIMEMTRHDPLAGPLQLGPTIAGRTGPFCRDPLDRLLDPLIGSWTSEPEEGSDWPPATLEVYPILGGCAQMDELTVPGPGGVHKRFHVRLRDGSGEWSESSVHNSLGSLDQRSGPALNDDRIVLSNEIQRETWEWADDEIKWSEEELTDGVWALTRSVEFFRSQ